MADVTSPRDISVFLSEFSRRMLDLGAPVCTVPTPASFSDRMICANTYPSALPAFDRLSAVAADIVKFTAPWPLPSMGFCAVCGHYVGSVIAVSE